jgi:ABC-type multidrug transport system fused ATPase/permease subunit
MKVNKPLFPFRSIGHRRNHLSILHAASLRFHQRQTPKLTLAYNNRMEINYSARKKALENQIRRLERRIANLQALSRRYSWIRVGVVLLGGLATWIVAAQISGTWGWRTFFGMLLIFLIVAYYHRRLEGWIEKLQIWLDVQGGQLGRVRLDWERIPEPTLPAKRARKPLEIDLDITGPHSLHQLVDIAVSRQGSELLAEWLSQPVPELHQIHRRQGIVRELALMPRFRDRLLLSFRLISKEPLEGNKLLRWLEEAYPSDKLKWMLPVSALFVATNVALFLLNSFGKLPPYWIPSLFLYGVFYFSNVSALGEFLEAMLLLHNELGKFKALLHYLETYPYADNVNLSALCRPFCDPENLPSRRIRNIELVTTAVGLRMNPVLSLLLNAVLPWDFLVAYLAAQCRSRMSQMLPLWLETFYQLEALISLANFAYLHPETTFPEIAYGTKPVFQAEGLGHPLIPHDQKVCNDFTVQGLGELIVITGSNMAGKSTFIKTVGINLCLAYAGGPVNATRLYTAPFRLCTCIRITDSVTDGFSYFYSEVKCLKHLLDELSLDHPLPLLYLIDEIFRGTNNRERLIGSRSYVNSLIERNGIGFLATHDLELASLAEQNLRMSNFHFRDSVHDGRLVFDYKIHPGPSRTTNALKIMQIEGLPIEQ